MYASENGAGTFPMHRSCIVAVCLISLMAWFRCGRRRHSTASALLPFLYASKASDASLPVDGCGVY